MTPEAALVDVTARLTRLGVAHALVGGLAVSLRAEVRFTRDVELAISVDTDADVERITRALAVDGFSVVAVVEQDDKKRIAIARLRSPSGIVVDLLTASSGIEHEIDARGLLATGPVDMSGFGRGQDLRAKLDALLAEQAD